MPETSRRHYRIDRSFIFAILVFVSSRLVVLLAIAFSGKFVQPSGGKFAIDVTPRWYRYLLRWDSGWYLKIASEEYSYNGDDLVQHPVVFYPFYPLISRNLASLLNISEAAALLIVSNIAILLAVPLFFRLVRESHGDQVAFYAVAALCFFPSSLFFSAGYTESLALLIIVGFFSLLRKKRFVFAAALAGLALATRSTGLILLLPLVIELWRKFYREPKRLVAMAVPCVILATAGMWLYMVYLWLAFKSPFAFLTGTRAWQNNPTTASELFEVLTLQPFHHLADIYKFGPDPNTLSAWFFILFVVLIIFFRKRLAFSLWTYTLGVLLLPYVTLSGNVGFVSFTRYSLMAFPVFIILGELFKRRLWLRLSILGIFSAMLFMYTALYAQWYWAG